ncbi:MAG: hypothetical protein ACRD3L_02600 [Terriglobales bacterium]
MSIILTILKPKFEESSFNSQQALFSCKRIGRIQSLTNANCCRVLDFAVARNCAGALRLLIKINAMLGSLAEEKYIRALPNGGQDRFFSPNASILC